MHFLLLGATGRTGQHVVSELLSQGHTAVALVRTSGSLAPRLGLTVVTGSPLSKSDIKSALSAAPSLTPSAAIMTLNTVRKSDSPFAPQVSPPRFLADSCANICEALEQVGISRIVVMSTAGVGDSWANLPWLSKAFMGWANIKYALEDHGLVDKEVRLTKMDWTLVRAVRLQFDDPKQKPTETKADVQALGSKGDGMRMTDSVSVSSVARFLVKVAVEGLFIKSAVVVVNSNPKCIQHLSRNPSTSNQDLEESSNKGMDWLTGGLAQVVVLWSLRRCARVVIGVSLTFSTAMLSAFERLDPLCGLSWCSHSFSPTSCPIFITASGPTSKYRPLNALDLISGSVAIRSVVSEPSSGGMLVHRTIEELMNPITGGSATELVPGAVPIVPIPEMISTSLEF
ncbi:hypothetical protein AUP68_08450 [Ilyonectria robusta]